VAIADPLRVVWADEFDKALALLLGQVQGQIPPAQTAVAAAGGAGISASARTQVQEVISAFKDYKDAVGRGDFTAAGQHLDRINSLLGSLSQDLGQ
jgi:adenylosuccinate synthase